MQLKYIDAEKLISILNDRIERCEKDEEDGYPDTTSSEATLKSILSIIISLQQELPEPYFYCKYGGTMSLCSDCKRNHNNSSFKTEEITTWYSPLNGTKHCIDYIQQEQPELSNEFEIAINRRLNLINGENLTATELLEETKGMAAELLDLARKVIEKEQPEVDLEKEMDNDYDSPLWDGEDVSWMTYTRIARHFYEFGLNARKEQSEIELDKFIDKVDTFQRRYKHPEIMSIKGAMAFMARMFYQYPNVAKEWYEQLSKATMD